MKSGGRSRRSKHCSNYDCRIFIKFDNDFEQCFKLFLHPRGHTMLIQDLMTHYDGTIEIYRHMIFRHNIKFRIQNLHAASVHLLSFCVEWFMWSLFRWNVKTGRRANQNRWRKLSMKNINGELFQSSRFRPLNSPFYSIGWTALYWIVVLLLTDSATTYKVYCCLLILTVSKMEVVSLRPNFRVWSSGIVIYM